ncbi:MULTISPECIES: NADP-dependent oxidoreductase [Sphingobium]|uniref:NADP-dependent oxidoreductase n=1 Tax=Sphingobium fuliginis ATCC 27551 TaxID=1208342 RepID=A0A5B8CDL1_SPHSA|nr:MULTISPECIES: NADP-dependent oxidoreductase [Sphingobium]OAP33621.1 NADP-dependent oxidoreductase [Sphingobium sp. 20006FA]AJR25389.1 alcohol dehydrogenase [Sphingobium sp. YBL2]KXU33555.1 NADP-dependent oxidoreductase [Sphingobium sp. AM]KYC34010.1 NADP-dependent oxidoreductase [Sphingobium sp. 22B]QDC36955.1 NADP-dependent oxidoreductase [Sphingobium fuliginis ATCC 27551]
MTDLNRQVLLTSRPAGIAQAENFAIGHAPIQQPAPGQILVRNHYLSIEPAMRGWIADAGNYAVPVAIGSVMRSLASGEVVASAHPDYAVGEYVSGWFGWQDYACVPADEVVQRTTAAEMRASLGILGINGMTAYLALTLVGQPRAGETIAVSTAAGAVGSAVGQIAHILGCRTIGIAGGPTKVRRCVEEYGYDRAIDYRAGNISAAIAEHAPEGIDIYFDNVAGAISDSVLPHLAQRGRVIVCGTASIDRWDPWPMGPRVERHLLVKRARMEGFVIFDHLDRYAEATAQLRTWIAQGHLTWREDILEGIEACPDALAGLYRGENDGKRLIRLV